MEGQSRTKDIIVKVPIDEDAVGGTNSSVHQDDKTVDTDATQTKDKTTKMSSSSRFCIDIYGRVPGKEPKYNIFCPSKLRENISDMFQFTLIINNIGFSTRLVKTVSVSSV